MQCRRHQRAAQKWSVARILNNGTLTLTNSKVTGNTAAHDTGGGIYTDTGGTLTNSTVIGNIAPSHPATMAECSFRAGSRSESPAQGRLGPERDTAREMSQANVENLRAFLENFSSFADLQALSRGEADVSLLDPNVTFEDTVLPDEVGETYRGREGLAKATARWIENAEDITVELEQIVGSGDRLVSIVRARAKWRYTGIEFDTPYAYLWTFRDGRVISFRSYLDPEEALQAAGLSEQDARTDI